jgi:hypothetical protein
MKRLKNNGLSLVFILLFVISIIGQAITGLKEYNNEMEEKGGQPITMGHYFSSGHFIEATFENWESEFLQMAMFVVLTIFLYQKGSSESKDPDKEKEEVDREPNPKKRDAPWPVKKGGLILSLYKQSLFLALFLLFIVSFFAHLYGSLKDYNQEQFLKHQPTESAMEFIGNNKFWFESFQNWQSEFLSVFAIVILSVFLRQKGSPQSKPVDAPDHETGE